MFLMVKKKWKQPALAWSTLGPMDPDPVSLVCQLFSHVFPTTRMISMALCKNFFAQPSRCERVSVQKNFRVQSFVQKLMETWKSQSWKATNNFLPKSPNFDNETTARNRICSKKKKCNVYPRLINMSLLTKKVEGLAIFRKTTTIYYP